MGIPKVPTSLPGSLRCLFNEWWEAARWRERWDVWYYRAQRPSARLRHKCPRTTADVVQCYACPNRQLSLLDSELWDR